jgi:urea transport system permease protein
MVDVIHQKQDNKLNFYVSKLIIIFSVILFISFAQAQSEAGPQVITEVANQLAGAKLKQVSVLVDQLSTLENERLLPLLSALVDGKLYFEKKSKRLVTIAILQDKTIDSDGFFDDKPIENVKKNTLRKVKTNNKLRSKIRKVIAQKSLGSKNIKLRESAVKSIFNDLTEENVALLYEIKEIEINSKIISLIDTALAIANLKSVDDSLRLQALASLKGNLEPVVRNQITKLLEKDAEGRYKEKNTLVIASATKTLKNIEESIKFYGYIETLFFGLSLGSVLLLIAAGLAITFGVMGVINMAHGEMIMLGAYTTYVVQLLMPNHLALSILISIPAAFIVSASVGIIIERGVIQFLKGRPLETLLATFGISLILQQCVRSIFSPLNRQVSTPEFMSGALEINPIFFITYNRLYILIFALVVFFLLQLILRKTSLGLNVRAVSQNRDMAKCMGIRTDWVDAMTFGLGSGIAGLAGVALSQITNVGPNLGQAYIIDSFMVVVFGGVGNLWGTLVGGFTLGVLNKFLEPQTGAVLANIIVLVGIILFIQKRPRGLFPQKGRAAE